MSGFNTNDGNPIHAREPQQMDTDRQAGTGRQKNTEMYTAFTTPSQRKATAPPPPAASNTPANSGAAESFVYASDFAAPPPQTPLMEKAMAAQRELRRLRSLLIAGPSSRRLGDPHPEVHPERLAVERDMLADIEEEGFKGVERSSRRRQLPRLNTRPSSRTYSSKRSPLLPVCVSNHTWCRKGRRCSAWAAATRVRAAPGEMPAAAVAVPAVPVRQPIEFDLLGLESTPSAVNTSSGGEITRHPWQPSIWQSSI